MCLILYASFTAPLCYSFFGLEGGCPEFDSISCLVVLLYLLVIIILHCGKSSRFSLSKTMNKHGIR